MPVKIITASNEYDLEEKINLFAKTNHLSWNTPTGDFRGIRDVKIIPYPSYDEGKTQNNFMAMVIYE